MIRPTTIIFWRNKFLGWEIEKCGREPILTNTVNANSSLNFNSTIVSIEIPRVMIEEYFLFNRMWNFFIIFMKKFQNGAKWVSLNVLPFFKYSFRVILRGSEELWTSTSRLISNVFAFLWTRNPVKLLFCVCHVAVGVSTITQRCRNAMKSAKPEPTTVKKRYPSWNIYFKRDYPYQMKTTWKTTMEYSRDVNITSFE